MTDLNPNHHFLTPEEWKDVFTAAISKMEPGQRVIIDSALAQLTSINGVGGTSALESLGRLAMFLSGYDPKEARKHYQHQVYDGVPITLEQIISIKTGERGKGWEETARGVLKERGELWEKMAKK